MNQITFKQYRNIDLTILTVITIIFEAIVTLASAKWFAAQPVAMSLTLTIVCIAMMRWSGYAAILAVVGGVVYCIASGAAPEQYLIYCVGNLFALVSLLIVKLFGKERIRTSIPRLMLFAAVAYAGMAVGRGIVSLFFGGELMTFVVFATTDIISLLFAVVILIILRKTDGMIEDQKAYLFRLERERKEKENTSEPEEEYYQ